MAQIYNVRNNGNSQVSLGLKYVNSYNVAPSTYVATPTPFTSIPNSVWINNDFFNVTQTSAATDSVILPTYVGINKFGNLPAAQQGGEWRVYAVTAIKVLPPQDGGSTINGAAYVAGKGVSIPAGSIGYFMLTYVNPATGYGTWVSNLTSTAGVITTPTPS